MKRIARRPARFVATGVVVVGAALTLSGCVLASPAVTNNPYPASDGSAATITDPASKTTVKLLNFLVVGTAKGKAGSLVGSVINTGTADVTVQLSVTSDAAGTASIGEAAVPVAGGEAVQVGPAATALTLSSVPQPPGSVLTLVAKTNGGGSVKVTVPVMAAANAYATLTPSATPTVTPTPKAAPKAAPPTSAKPSASATS